MERKIGAEANDMKSLPFDERVCRFTGAVQGLALGVDGEAGQDIKNYGGLVVEYNKFNGSEKSRFKREIMVPIKRGLSMAARSDPKLRNAVTIIRSLERIYF
jgi:hypothetical protein